MKSKRPRSKVPQKIDDPEMYYFLRAFYRFHHDDYAGAAADCSLAIEGKADFVEAFFLRGRVLEELNPGQAIKDYTRALRLRPDYAEALYRRGLTHAVLLVDPITGLNDFNAALAVNAEHAGAKQSRDLVLGFLRENGHPLANGEAVGQAQIQNAAAPLQTLDS